jgi:hypothetical protein
MPPFVDKCVSKRLKDPKFYPDLKGDKRETRAYQVCWTVYKKKKKKRFNSLTEGQEQKLPDFFDGALNLNIVTNSVKPAKEFLADESLLKAFEGFNKIKPTYDNSFMFLAEVQSDKLFTDELYGESFIEISEEVIISALPALERDDMNVIFSSHRYSDEYAVGLVRKIYKKQCMAICEIFTTDDCPQGKIVAGNIKKGLTKGVSTGMVIREQECSLCGSKGSPWVRCDHFPGDEYDGKVAKNRITKIIYFEVSTVTMPRDPTSLVIRHNHILNPEVFSSDLALDETYLREIDRDSNILSKNKEETKIMSQREPDENTQSVPPTVNKEIMDQINALVQQNKQIISQLKNVESQNASLTQQNQALTAHIADQNKSQKDQIINKIIDLKLKSNMITAEKIEEEKTHLASLDPQQLKRQYDDAVKINQLLSGNAPPSEPSTEIQNASIPASPDRQKMKINIQQLIQQSNYEVFKERLEKRTKKKPRASTEDNPSCHGFEPIQEFALVPVGKPIKKEGN